MELKKNSFLKNFSVLTVSNIIVNILGLFINVYLARKLTPDVYGEYGVLITTVNIFYTISSLGLQQIVIRSIARDQNNSRLYFHISFIARILGLIFSIILFLIYSIYLKPEFTPLILTMMILYMISLSIWDAYQNLAFGLQRMEYTGYINVLASAATLILYLLYPVQSLNLVIVFSIILIVQLVKNLMYYYNLKTRNFFTGSKSDKSNLMKDVLELIKQSFPYYILSIFTLLTTQLPIIFIDFNTNTKEVAFFNTANKLLVPLTLLISTAMTALFPELSKLYVTNKEIFQKKIDMAFGFIVFLGIYFSLLVTLFRNEAVFLLFGNEYSETGNILAFQCWYIVMYSIFWFFGVVFGSTDNQNLLGKLSIVYAFVSVPILWFASKYNAETVSKAYILIAMINMTYHYYYFQKVLPRKISKLHSFLYFGGLLFFLILSFLIPDNLSLILKISIASIISVCTVFIIKKFLKVVKSV